MKQEHHSEQDGHVYDNPKGLLNHVDDIMKAVEEKADDNEIWRIMCTKMMMS